MDPPPRQAERLSGDPVRAGNGNNEPVPGQAFTQFYRAAYPEILAFARMQAGPHLDVEDIVSEAFARACAWWPQIDKPRPWVYRTVIHLIADAGRHGQRCTPDADPCPDDRPSPRWKSGTQLPGAEYGALISDLTRGLQQLPHHQRAAVLLDYRGWSRTEIAAILGCSAITVRGHLHRGRARLRELAGEPSPSRTQASSTGLEGRTA